MCADIATFYYTFIHNFTILIRFNLIKRSFVKIIDESTNNIKNKKKTFVDNKFFATTLRDIIEIDNVKQQLFTLITKKKINFELKSLFRILKLL